jgi:hypothetical protein
MAIPETGSLQTIGYGGAWRRAGAALIDLVLLVPVTLTLETIVTVHSE